MSTKGPTPDLRTAIRSNGFVPRKADAKPLLELLGGSDEDEAERAERALGRLGEAATAAVLAAYPSSRAPLRGRLVRVVGRVASDRDDDTLRRFLLERLHDEDAKARRNAVIALGKLRGDDIEDALVATYGTSPPVELRRSIVASLGKIGSRRSLELVRGIETDDRELARIRDEAKLKLERTLGRSSRGSIDPSARLPEASVVRLHCRRGLEEIVREESDRLSSRVLAEGVVEATLDGPLQILRGLRTPLRFAFPLASKKGDPIEIVADAIASDRAASILSAFGKGLASYRLEWASAGHRRSATFEVARRVARVRPELVNDPTETLWEIVVAEEAGNVDVEIWPRGLPDDRFRYRIGDVPGASHPTIAAALAFVAARSGIRDDEVVWDPFVGSGTELIERAMLGPYSRLLGSDVSQDAITIARRNLDIASVRAELMLADARSVRPKVPPTLVLTNPPMGRRVLSRDELVPLYETFLRHAAEVVADDARLVWISPLFDRSITLAEAVGFRTKLRKRVDMGGFSGEIQAFVRGKR